MTTVITLSCRDHIVSRFNCSSKLMSKSIFILPYGFHRSTTKRDFSISIPISFAGNNAILNIFII